MFILVFCTLLGTVFGGIFDFTEFEDPIEPISKAQARGFLTDNSVCSVSNPGTGVVQYGQCAPPTGCNPPSISPGQGTCGTLSSCCIYQAGCGTTTNRKITYFSYDGSTQSTYPANCQYKITPYNNNICQVRVDFVKFQLTSPRQPPGSTTVAFQCLDDYLSIQTANPKIPARICGYNTGQHLYLPMNVTDTKQKSVTFIVSLASRTPASSTTVLTSLTTPVWSLRISQLECPGSASAKGTNADRDFLALAPPGCLQYYTDRTGTVMNLGYNPGTLLANNFYLPNMDYSLCFRRDPTQCSIKFTVVQFRIGGLSNAMPPACTFTDYLFLSESNRFTIAGTGAGQTVTQTPFTNVYCGTQLSITGTTSAAYIETSGQFPFALHFKTDEATGSGTENGWLLNYEVNSC